MDSPVFSGHAINPNVPMMPGQIIPSVLEDEPPAVMNIVIVKGDSKTIPLRLSLDGIDPIDLTDATIDFTVKESPQDAQLDAKIHKSAGAGITVLDPPTDGNITIDFAPADTDQLEELLPMTFDIQVVDSEGKKSTLDRGVFTVTNGVTT